jgi:hypothetical protein
MLKMLKELKIKSFPDDYYIFSTGYIPGCQQINSNTPTLHWREIVKDGLKIKKDLYGLKKLGGNDMIDLQINAKS